MELKAPDFISVGLGKPTSGRYQFVWFGLFLFLYVS